jgi:hypothetical protein
MASPPPTPAASTEAGHIEEGLEIVDAQAPTAPHPLEVDLARHAGFGQGALVTLQ